MAAAFCAFYVETLSGSAQVKVLGITLGDLRQAVELEFGIPPFEQQIVYRVDAMDHVLLKGDGPVLMREKSGLLDAKVLNVVRQVDPQYKTERETAFLDALDGRRFREAKEILESSGVTVDPSCTRARRSYGHVALTECPNYFRHPALTVAMMAGLERAVEAGRCAPAKLRAFMSDEDELCEVVALMIQKGADVNAVGSETQECESAGRPSFCWFLGKTPLCAAVQRGSPRLVRMLLDANADPNHRHRYEFSPDVLKPESWLSDISNGSVWQRHEADPRNRFTQEILQMLSPP